MLHASRHAVLAAIVALHVGFATVARADVVAPGQKSVDHVLVFEGLERFPALAFWLFDEKWPDRSVRVENGRPVSFYKMMSPRLVAIPGGTDPAALTDALPAAQVGSERTFSLDVSAPEHDPVSRRVTTYRVADVARRVIAVEDLGTRELDAAGRPVGAASRLAAIVLRPLSLALLAGVVLIVIGLVRLRARRNVARGNA